MGRFLLVGNIAGYLVACLIYGQLLPVLTAPAIIGALVGGAVTVVGVVVLVGAEGGPVSKGSSAKERWKEQHRLERMNRRTDSKGEK